MQILTSGWKTINVEMAFVDARVPWHEKQRKICGAVISAYILSPGIAMNQDPSRVVLGMTLKGLLDLNITGGKHVVIKP